MPSHGIQIAFRSANAYDFCSDSVANPGLGRDLSLGATAMRDQDGTRTGSSVMPKGIFSIIALGSGLALAALVATGADAATPPSGTKPERRVALVIGNSNYQSVSPLPNPVKDAGAIAELFTKAGFEVVKARN